MVKHTQTISRETAMNCLSVFDNFAGLALKALRNAREFAVELILQ